MDSFITLNSNSFKCHTKRVAFFKLLRKHKAIGFIQESHTISHNEPELKAEWEGEILASHGTSNSAGVIIFMPKGTVYENIFRDNDG